MKKANHFSSRFSACLFLVAVAGSVLTQNAIGQVRGIAGGALVLDDYHGHTVSIQAPLYGSPEANAWSHTSPPYAPLIWEVPIPPTNNAQSGFLYVGPLTPTTSPYPSTVTVPYWLYPNQPSLSGDGHNGGSDGAWDYATTAQLGIVTAAGALTPNSNVSTDATGNFVTIANGGANTVLHGATPPSWSAIVNADITNSTISYSKIQNEGTHTLLGNPTAGLIAPEEITLGTGLSFSGTTLNVTASSGTVTSFSSGNLSPLFTTSVATATTTPALSFTLSTVTAANQFFANTTGGSAPAFRSIAATDLPASITSNTSGNAATASALSPGAQINGVNFTGASNITVTAAPSGAAGGGLTGTYPNPTVGSISAAVIDAAGAITNNTSGNAATATVLSPGANINGVLFTGGSNITVTAAPSGPAGGGLTGTYPNPTVASISAAVIDAAGAITNNTSGNAATVTTDANLTGPVTSVGNATTITAGAVTYANIQNEGLHTLLGNPTGTAAAPEEITLGTGLSFSGTTLNGTGGTVTSFSSGNLSPLFTTSVATPTSTPALSFTLSTVTAANQFFANTTGGSAPAFRSIAATDLPASITSNTSGNAATASALSPGAQINGVTFTGAAPITVTAAMNTLTGTNYAAGNGSALTNLTAANISAGTAGINISGNAATVTTDANLTGPVTSVGNATTITNGAVTYANIQNETHTTLLGNPTAATNQAPSEITLGSGLSFTGSVLNTTNSGSLTSFSSGNLSPLFTTSVATATTTPALSFTLSTVTAANQFFANLAGGSAPAFRSIAATDLPASITSSTSGNAATASALSPGANINGVAFTGASNITVTAAAGTLTGTTLASNVVSSSLTSVGTLGNLTVTNPINGSVTGNAATVTTDANLTGPVTSSGNATSITAGAVTYAKIQNETPSTLLGNPTAATSEAPSEITLGSGLSFTGSVLNTTNSGSLTSFSSGNLSPLFTTSVATATTTPALSFTLSTVTAANQFFANLAGGSAPAFRSIAATDLPASITSNTSGNAATASALSPGAQINGVTFTGASNITVTAAAGTLTGTTLASNVVSSSLTSVGTLGNLTVTNPINGSVTGNAATVTTDANLTGPVTSVGNATTITNGAVTYANIQNETHTTLLGNPTAATNQAPSEITLGSGLAFSGTTLTATGSGGTVTSFSSGNLSPLFTTSVATPTSTPALSFTLSTVTAANQFFANLAGGSAPAFRSIAATDLPASITSSTSGNAATASALSPGATINGVTFTGAAPITVTAAMNTLTGTNYAAGNGSALTNLTAANISAGTAGINISGNAATVTTDANLTGPVTSVGNATTITAGAVTYSNIQNETPSTLLGNPTAATNQAPGEITLGSGLAFSGTTLTATGSGGTVTSFSSGNLSPLFTTSVATPTSTPALSFTLSTVTAANQFFANTTGGSAPAFRSIAATDLPATITSNTSGNAATASALSPGATINGVTFTGAAPITVTAAMNTLTGTNYAAGNGSALTNLTAANISAGTAGINISGNAATVTTDANLTGPVTSSGNATSITNSAVTYAKIQNETPSTLLGNPTAATSEAPSEITLGSGLSFTGGVLNTVNTGTGVNYNVNAAQNTAATTNNLFDVEYPAAGVASAPGAIINSIGTAGTATGLTVTARGGTSANNAIAAIFEDSSSTSYGITINGTGKSAAGNGNVGLFIGKTGAPDIGAELAGVSTDLKLAGSYSTGSAYALTFAGSASVSTDAALAVVPNDYPNVMFASGKSSGIYAITTATSVASISPTSFGTFNNGFGVCGNATGTPSTAVRIVGVYGIASGVSGTNTSSIGVLAQGQGQGLTYEGSTNVALEVSNGELTMGLTTDPNGKSGAGVSLIGSSQADGPSGQVQLTTTLSSESGPYIQEQDFTVGNEYCASNSIVLATVINDPDNGNSTFNVQVAPASGSFKLKVTQTVLTSKTSTGSPTVNVGYIIVNPSR